MSKELEDFEARFHAMELAIYKKRVCFNLWKAQLPMNTYRVFYRVNNQNEPVSFRDIEAQWHQTEEGVVQFMIYNKELDDNIAVWMFPLNSIAAVQLQNPPQADEQEAD